MKILVLDNYDSFTYNLVHYIEELASTTVDVFRNNEIEINDIDKYTHIVLSPGPGLPKDAGILIDLIKRYSDTKKILGVCLGMQAIAEAFGGELTNLETVFHGISTPATITKDDMLFTKLPKTIEIGRYHSWVAKPEMLPKCLEVICVDENNQIMALRHKTLNVRGVQFHPESVLTPDGKIMIQNWLNS